MRHFPFILSILLLPLLLSCDGRPAGVPSAGKMERVLYDYHKAQAIINVGGVGHTPNAERCMLYVLEKHGLNSEMFDSAMIWYCEHPEILQKIYQNLEKRLNAENEELQAKVGTSEMSSIYSEGGDTTNLWTGAKLIVLRPENVQSVECFTLKVDSSYRSTDRFILNSDVKFVKEDRNLRSILYMNLSITTADGKVYSQTQETRVNTIQRIDLSQASEEDIKEVSGFFYYKCDKSAKSLCVINGISLIRMHMPEPSDTATVDSITTDSVVGDDQRRIEEESPRIPSMEMSEKVPERIATPKTGSSRKNEVEDIRIQRAPETSSGQPLQRRQSVQKSRGQNQPQQPPRQRQNGQGRPVLRPANQQ